MPVPALMLIALATAADAPGVGVATLAPPPTTQQQFDAATAAYATQRCAEAVPMFEALAARPGLARNAHVQAVIRVRKGYCLVTLGRLDEAATELEKGLASLDGGDASNREELVAAHMALGRLAYLGFDYDQATREFDAARALGSGDEPYEALVWLSRSAMFDEGPLAASAAEEALQIAGAHPELDKASMAALHTIHARALLNHGQHAAAYAELKEALKAEGGLTTRVSLADVVTRSDLALAAMLSGDKEPARKYLAWTGAGRFEDSPFATAAEMDPPPCGGPANLQADDFAIVEFGIHDDGSVANVSPIYASRSGPAAAEFARAVAGWSWRPTDAARIPAFFRSVTRVELRCSMGSQHPDLLLQLLPVLDAWMVHVGLEPFPEGATRAATVVHAKAMLAHDMPEGRELEALPALLALAQSPIIPAQEQRQWLQRARDLAAAFHAPVAAVTFLDVRQSESLARERGNYRKHRDTLRSLLARPEVAADPRTAATLRLLVAEAQYGSRSPSDAVALVTATATDPQLPDFDPLRTGALVRLATLQAAAGDLAAARSSYAQSGLSDQQCSLVDAVPGLRRYGTATDSFPGEALAWGFEGWVAVEFDIQADGSTARQRPIVAYPPLVFGDSALKVIRASVYAQSFRPGGTPGCGSKKVSINYRMGH